MKNIIKFIFGIIFGVVAVVVIICAIYYITTHSYKYMLIMQISMLIGGIMFLLSYVAGIQENKKLKLENERLENEINLLKFKNG